MHNNAQSDHFDLLPFIAILMCVLGCLLLVTISMAAINLGIGAGEAWVPTSESDIPTDSKLPILVEWDGKTATFHEDGGVSRIVWMVKSTRDMIVNGQKYLLTLPGAEHTNAEFTQVLERLTSLAPTHYILVAVRPSGFTTMNKFIEEFRRNDITVGYEPIDQNKPVRLSLPPVPTAPNALAVGTKLM